MAALRTLGAQAAARLDEQLMSTGAFSIDQLMELAGLAVAQAAHALLPHPRSSVLIAVGPGNNGGDGLVAARHLHHFQHRPTVYYPKQPSKELYGRLATQLRNLEIPIITTNEDFLAALDDTDLVVDAIFGFSFAGEVREPFPGVIAALERTKKQVLAVDAPSSWNIEEGPPKEGPGRGYMPSALISLTAPKPLVRWFKGERHFVGGRFLSEKVAEEFGIDVPDYKGSDQIVEVPLSKL